MGITPTSTRRPMGMRERIVLRVVGANLARARRPATVNVSSIDSGKVDVFGYTKCESDLTAISGSRRRDAFLASANWRPKLRDATVASTNPRPASRAVPYT